MKSYLSILIVVLLTGLLLAPAAQAKFGEPDTDEVVTGIGGGFDERLNSSSSPFVAGIPGSGHQGGVLGFGSADTPYAADGDKKFDEELEVWTCFSPGETCTAYGFYTTDPDEATGTMKTYRGDDGDWEWSCTSPASDCYVVIGARPPTGP